MRSSRGLGSVYRHGATWWVVYHVRGQRYRESSGSINRADAVRLLKRRLLEAGSGRPHGADVEKTTWGQLARMLRDDYQANGRRGLKRIGGALKHLGRHLGDSTRAADLTSDRITAYIARRQEEQAAAATINRELAALKRAFSLAERAGRLARRPHISMLQEANARKGFFEAEQVEALLAELPDYLKPVIETAYVTGWRIASELLTRQRYHLDLKNGWLRLEPNESKNGQGRMFPLTPELREVLQRQAERTRALELKTAQVIPWLFHHDDGSRIRDFRYAWQVACRRAGLAGRIPHDFRRTAVRNLERAGVPRSAAMAMVGHKTEAIYRRYAIADEGMLKESAAKLATLRQTERRSSAGSGDRKGNATVSPQ